MLRRALLAAVLVSAVACSKSHSAKKGPVVARGHGVTITADELKARLDEQSPMVRGSFQSAERKKQFLDNLIRFELLAQAAEREGLSKDPDVQFTMKKVMVSKYYQKHFQDADGAKNVPEADLKKYYDEHEKDEFSRPARLHALNLFLAAPEGSPERAAKAAQAKKLLAKVMDEEKKDATAFSRAARESSDDAASKAMGGDLGFKTQEELAKAVGNDVANAIAKLSDNQTAPTVLETPQGFHLVRLVGRQPEMKRSFDEVKGQIAAKLNGQRRTKDFDDLMKKLREEANVKVYDDELEKVQVAAAAPGGGAPHGAMRGMGAMGGARGAAPAEGSQPATVTATPSGPAPAGGAHPAAPAPAKR
jgi:peptidyl-prolyl cis-trans isomerase C